MQSELMPNFLKKRAFLTPDRVAIYFNDESITFKELYNRSFEIAGKLQGLGFRQGDFTGVLLRNHLDTVIILFALQLIGIRAVILNNRLTPTELSWQLNDSKARFLLLEPSFSNVIDSMDSSLKCITKDQLFKATMVHPMIQEEVDLLDICTVMYTSGTTGNPKGVIQTYGNHWWSSVGSAFNLGLMEQDCWLCTVPIFHISGFSILMRSVIYGMTIVLHESFDVERTLQDIEEKKVTIMSVVSTMLTRMVDRLGEQRLPEYFRCMLLGGGPAPLPLLEACVEKAIPVFQTYGMTETASQIVTLSPEYSLAKLGSAGKPLFPAQIKVELEEGVLAPEGKAGEIIVKGPNVTTGYLYRPDATANKVKNGWLYTGDIGYLDSEGFLFVLDRRADLIISGGENIYPAEIEAVLLAHPSVADAGVIGIEDEAWGQVPVSFIVKNIGMNPSQEEIQQFCMEKLAKYKVPKQIFFLESLPRNAAKKLLRRELRELVNEGRVER
ncbi:MAG: o-succinylbenzoate--CoA ligase [Bacillota bacterium]|nr:o-succinylbenzoate--CoA ligase [Bacillota bacterium]